MFGALSYYGVNSEFDLIFTPFAKDCRLWFMASTYEQQEARTYFMIGTDSGEKYTFHYGHNPVDLMCGLVLHREGEEPKRMGSAVPMHPITLGASALLGVDTCFKEFHLQQTSEVTSIGPAPAELIGNI